MYKNCLNLLKLWCFKMTTVIMEYYAKTAKEQLQSWANFTQSNRQPFSNPGYFAEYKGI